MSVSDTAVGCGLWAVGCGLWAVGCGLWAVGCQASAMASSLDIALDAPEWRSHDALPRLEALLPVINRSVRDRWASVHTQDEPVPSYRLWVEGTDTGVAFGYRPRSGESATKCPVLEFVRAAIRYAVRGCEHELCVFLDKPFVHLPCSTRPTPTFLEDLWRQTGADVPGEEAGYSCVCGLTHAIKLTE
jgi:hypothetical protein